MNARRIRLRIGGTVQGVGFRPFVYQLAHSLELNGFVRNDSHGVVVEIEGSTAALDDFIQRLPCEAPPLASCGDIVREEIEPRGTNDFAIIESSTCGDPSALITPDTATCDACLRELFDQTNRRFRYPFLNCTNCGPRFTIVRGVPYDRQLTTMASFAMCVRCRAEYDDPTDRRFHAQPNACPRCGPRARLIETGGESSPLDGADDAVGAAARALRDGAIVAVKGLGGYHLACCADCESVVRRLRERKHREEKPFAIMVSDLADARHLAALSGVDEQLLLSRERPIVLVRRRAGAAVAPAVAPRQRDLGLMLPYAPLHHLLLADAGTPLVMTSGNVSDEPIAYRDDDALVRLSSIADLFLVHDREIEWRVDDSVVRAVSVASRGATQRPMMIRRSRGHVPIPLRLPVAAAQPLLACGAHLKNTFCVVRERQAWLGPHVGDLSNYETLRAFAAGIAHHEALCALTPRAIAHDRHPEYLSTKYAVDRADASPESETVSIQHHHAHLAACLAEHGECGPAIGIVFDGAGYGLDGAIWGGEVLLGDLEQFARVGHLWPVRMPGGEAAVHEPWRMACAWMTELAGDAPPPVPRALVRRVGAREWDVVASLARRGLSSPYTTSIGRLLDGVSALCGVRHTTSYEGQAAIELEMMVDDEESGAYGLSIVDSDGTLILDARPLVADVVRDIERSLSVRTIAARVHNGIAAAAARSCAVVARRSGVRTVVLSGGVFQNLVLLERTAAAVRTLGLRLLVPERVPPNDGGISFGQAAIAAARSRRSAAAPVTPTF